MNLFGRRGPKPGSVIPVNQGIAIQEIEVEKVILISGRELIGQVIERLRQEVDSLTDYRPWPHHNYNPYSLVRADAYRDIAGQLYTIAARPWFEEQP